jgi:hypothetical protein
MNMILRPAQSGISEFEDGRNGPGRASVWNESGATVSKLRNRGIVPLENFKLIISIPHHELNS